jgi:hypothetical protein
VGCLKKNLHCDLPRSDEGWRKALFWSRLEKGGSSDCMEVKFVIPLNPLKNADEGKY